MPLPEKDCLMDWIGCQTTLLTRYAGVVFWIWPMLQNSTTHLHSTNAAIILFKNVMGTFVIISLIQLFLSSALEDCRLVSIPQKTKKKVIRSGERKRWG